MRKIERWSPQIKEKPPQGKILVGAGRGVTGYLSPSEETRSLPAPERGYQPAFFDTRTNAVYVSRYSDGRPAPVHLSCNLPKSVRYAGDTRSAGSVKKSVVPGFLRGRRFISRQQLHSESGGQKMQRKSEGHEHSRGQDYSGK